MTTEHSRLTLAERALVWAALISASWITFWAIGWTILFFLDRFLVAIGA